MTAAGSRSPNLSFFFFFFSWKSLSSILILSCIYMTYMNSVIKHQCNNRCSSPPPPPPPQCRHFFFIIITSKGVTNIQHVEVPAPSRSMQYVVSNKTTHRQVVIQLQYNTIQFSRYTIIPPPPITLSQQPPQTNCNEYM